MNLVATMFVDKTHPVTKNHQYTQIIITRDFMKRYHVEITTLISHVKHLHVQSDFTLSKNINFSSDGLSSADNVCK